jgi:hypothetical protein
MLRQKIGFCSTIRLGGKAAPLNYKKYRQELFTIAWRLGGPTLAEDCPRRLCSSGGIGGRVGSRGISRRTSPVVVNRAGTNSGGGKWASRREGQAALCGPEPINNW